MTKPLKNSDPILAEALYPTLDALLKAAKDAGAQSADAVATHGRSLGIAVRDNALEDVESTEGRDIGLRVMIGNSRLKTLIADCPRRRVCPNPAARKIWMSGTTPL